MPRSRRPNGVFCSQTHFQNCFRRGRSGAPGKSQHSPNKDTRRPAAKLVSGKRASPLAASCCNSHSRFPAVWLPNTVLATARWKHGLKYAIGTPDSEKRGLQSHAARPQVNTQRSSRQCLDRPRVGSAGTLTSQAEVPLQRILVICRAVSSCSSTPGLEIRRFSSPHRQRLPSPECPPFPLQSADLLKSAYFPSRSCLIRLVGRAAARAGATACRAGPRGEARSPQQRSEFKAQNSNAQKPQGLGRLCFVL